jgi:hypothetical protein
MARSFDSSRSAALLGLVLVLVLCACKKRSAEAEATSESSAPPVASTAPKSAPEVPYGRRGFEISVPGGSQQLRVVPAPSGYRLESKGGDARGRIKVQPDRVKVQDSGGSVQAKVKAKEYGFKVYGAGEDAVLKAKRRGSGFAFKRSDGTELGRWESGQGAFSGAKVEVVERGGQRVVRRGGEEVAIVGTAVRADAAGLLALTELSFEQRLAILVFCLELVKP